MLSIISLIFSVPVLAFSYYNALLFVNALRYPRAGPGDNRICRAVAQKVSTPLAVYNERSVVGRPLDAFKEVENPKDLHELIVADDSTYDTSSMINEKVSELKSSWNGFSRFSKARERGFQKL